jgi:hypothetical protein
MGIPHNHPDRIRLVTLGTLNRLTEMSLWLESEAQDGAWANTMLPVELAEAARQLRYIREHITGLTGVTTEVTE